MREATAVTPFLRRAFSSAALTLGPAVASCGGDGTAPAASLSLSPASVTFEATLGGASPGSQAVSVTNSGGGGSLGSLVATISYGAGQPTGWLTSSLSGQTTPATLSLQAATGSLAAGSLTATVSLASGDAPNSPRTVSVGLTVRAADLTISAPAALGVTPTSVGAGGQVSLSGWTVLNAGNAGSSAYQQGFFLSTDATITTADRRLGGSQGSALAASASASFTAQNLTIPTDVVPGTYFIGILVDELAATGESDESNNFKSVALTVTGVAPLLRYTFDGNLTNSGSSAGFAGTATNTSFVAGKFGQAIKFDGSPSTGVGFAATAALLSGGFKWTISLWYRDDVLEANTLLWSNRGTTGGWETYHGASTESMTTCSDGGCLSYPTTASPAWRNLIFRYDGVSAIVGAPVEIFLDGVLVGSLTNPAALPLATAGTTDMKMGGQSGGSGRSVFSVDELRVYNAVFTAAQQCTQIIGGTWTGTSCTLP